MKEHLLLLPFALLLIILPFPGTVAIRLTTLTIALIVAWRIWLKTRHDNPPLPGKIPILLWVFTGLMSLTYAADLMGSLGDIKAEMLNTMASYFAFFVIASNAHHALYLIRTLAVGLILIGGWALLAWLSNDFSWNEAGRYGGVGVFATYLVTIFPAMAWLALSEKNQHWRHVAIAILPFILLLAFATGQRATWPALLLEIAIFFAFLYKQTYISARSKIGPILAFITITLLIATLFITQEEKRFSNITEPGESISTDVRLKFWPDVVTEIAKHPLTGGGFGRNAMKKAYPELIPQYNTWLWHPHNLFLTYGIGMGVPGILSIFILFTYLATFFWRATHTPIALAGVAGLALVAGVVFRNQFNDFFIRDQSLLFWAQIGLFTRLAITKKHHPKMSSV